MFREAQGGKLEGRHLDEAALGEARRRARDAKSWDLTPRQLCDLELLLNGAFAPLDGFMSAAEYEGVLRDMRLPSGAVWPVPVTLDVSEAFAAGLERGDTIALRDTGILCRFAVRNSPNKLSPARRRPRDTPRRGFGGSGDFPESR